jgi:hypothetical protein
MEPFYTRQTPSCQRSKWMFCILYSKSADVHVWVKLLKPRFQRYMMYVHIHSETPIRRFVDIGGDRVVAEATDGSLLLAATVDHLVWTEGVDKLMQHKNQRIAQQNLKASRRLWLTGGVSERARQGLAGLGWSVRPNLIHDYVGTLCNPAVPKFTTSGFL